MRKPPRPKTHAKLHDAIAAVCPIDGVSVGDWDDKSTWRIDFSSNASSVQKAAADTIVQTFNKVTDG